MNKSKPFSLLGTALLLCACDRAPSKLAFKIIAPLGAPGLALASYLGDPAFESAAPATVKGAIVNPGEEYKAVVFDAVTALRLGSTPGMSMPYRLARIVTGGNLFVAATGHDGDGKLAQGDTVVSFGAGNIPDRIYKLIHPEIAPTYYAPGVAEAANILCSGRYEGREVDYVVLAEPYLSSVKSNTTCPVKAVETEDVTASFTAYAQSRGYDLPGFPQAGLFLAQSVESDQSEREVKALLKSVDQTLADLVSGGSKTAKKLGELSESNQRDRFGLTADSLKGAGLSTRLGFQSGPYDLAAFYKLLELDYPAKELFSRYYEEPDN